MGRRVVFFSSQDKKEKCGTLRYYGSPEFAAGVWCGVELDRAEGKNNGSKHGIRYFNCEPGYGVFIPVERVQRDSRPSRSRPSSRPNSRPNSRPSSADRARKSGRGEEEGYRVKPAAVQQELARLVQHGPVTDHKTRRKMAGSSVTKSRQPMKAFAQTKDDTTVGSKSSSVQPVGVAGRALHRAASSENLRGAKVNGKPVKKSSSEQSLKGSNTLPRTAKSSKRLPRPQSVSSLDKPWPHTSTPKVEDEESGSAGFDGIVSSSSSSGSPEGNPPANTGFIVSTLPIGLGLSTHTSQFAEREKNSSGVCQVPTPNGGLRKGTKTAALSHPLSHMKSDLTLEAIMPLLQELMEQNQRLLQRQGIVSLTHCCVVWGIHMLSIWLVCVL